MSEAMATPPQELTALDAAYLVAESLVATTPAAAPAKVPAPHSSFKFPNFDGTEDNWVSFSRNVTQSLEMPYFVPGLDTLVTTNTNKTQSSQIRNCLYAALSKATVARFDNRGNLKFKGFKMIAISSPTSAPSSPPSKTATRSC